MHTRNCGNDPFRLKLHKKADKFTYVLGKKTEILHFMAPKAVFHMQNIINFFLKFQKNGNQDADVAYKI